MLQLVKNGLPDLSAYKVVILDTLYDISNQSLARKMFGEIVDLKVRGYLKEHPYGALPLDTSDFVAIHIVLCRETKDRELLPVMGYKAITLERCKIHGLAFPALTVARTAGLKDHEQAIQTILQRCEKDGVQISFDSSWTIDPEVRKDPTMKPVFRDLMTAINFRFHLDYRIPEEIGCGVIRLKTNRYFQSWGMWPLTLNGNELPPFSLASLLGETVQLMHLPEYSQEAKNLAHRYHSLWDNRLTLESAVKQATRTAQAA